MRKIRSKINDHHLCNVETESQINERIGKKVQDSSAGSIKRVASDDHIAPAGAEIERPSIPNYAGEAYKAKIDFYREAYNSSTDIEAAEPNLAGRVVKVMDDQKTEPSISIAGEGTWFNYEIRDVVVSLTGDYLTFSNGNASFELTHSSSATLEICTDAKNWVNFTSGTAVAASKGYCYVRGVGNTSCSGAKFAGNYDTVSGNIMSLLDGENPPTSLSECSDSTFYRCFYNNKNLKDASGLVFPSDVITECYNQMFNGCEALTDAPDLPAETLAISCYQKMFYNCQALTSVKCYATDISASGCIASWLANVTTTGTLHVKSGKETETWNTPSGWTVEGDL